jgi:hypothetical protein
MKNPYWISARPALAGLLFAALVLPGCAAVTPAVFVAGAGLVTAVLKLDDDAFQAWGLLPKAVPPHAGEPTPVMLVGRSYTVRVALTYQDGSAAPSPAGVSASISDVSAATIVLASDGLAIRVTALRPAAVVLSYLVPGAAPVDLPLSLQGARASAPSLSAPAPAK